jgi:Helitron helicase-like domain at N-terminus
MDWIKKHVQKDLRSVLPKELIEHIKKKNKTGYPLGKVYQAPLQWKGSNKHMQEKYSDAMAIARRHGNPTW